MEYRVFMFVVFVLKTCASRRSSSSSPHSSHHSSSHPSSSSHHSSAQSSSPHYSPQSPHQKAHLIQNHRHKEHVHLSSHTKRSNQTECTDSDFMLPDDPLIEPHGIRIGIVTARLGFSLETGVAACHSFKAMILGTGLKIDSEDGVGLCIFGSCLSIGASPTWFEVV